MGRKFGEFAFGSDLFWGLLGFGGFGVLILFLCCSGLQFAGFVVSEFSI